MGLGTELLTQVRGEAALLRLRRGQEQGVQTKHRSLVLIGTAMLGQQGADALVQRGEAGVVWAAVGLEALGQGHLEKVAAGMSREPCLQLGIDPIHEIEPGAAMHVATFLRRHDVAGDLRPDAVALDQQVEHLAEFDAGERDHEAAGTLEGGGAHDMEERHQGMAVPHGAGQDVGETLTGFCRNPTRKRHGVDHQGGDAALRRRWHRVPAPPQPLDHQLDGVTLQEGAAGPAGRRRPAQTCQARFPAFPADQRDKGVERRQGGPCVCAGHFIINVMVSDEEVITPA